MKQIIYAISLILLSGACTDEKYAGTLSESGESGQLVPVELVLNIEPLQSPLSSGTKAGGHAVRSTEVCKGLEVSLVETPVTRADYDAEIKSFMVFQFNGTEPTSTLIKKQTITNNSVKTVELTTSTVKNRIIVIANAGETTFNDLTEDSSTLADLNNMAISYNEGNGFPLHYPLLNSGANGTLTYSGATDMIVTSGKQADVMLYRSVARVKVDISLSSEMQSKGYTWSYQFVQVPKKSYYHSVGRVAPFPGEAIGYADYTKVSFTGLIEAYLPVNLHHPVPFTTPEKRATNAPAGATYLQLVGAKMSGSIITGIVTYQIHLGSNFTDDYSIAPNYSYTYTITITGESEDDSRVVKFIPGYFGGGLQTRDANDAVTGNLAAAVAWRYEKRIEVYPQDVSTGTAWVASIGDMPTSANSFMDGEANTLALTDNKYTAVGKCIGLNTGPVSEANIVWYLPSYGQSLGIYVAGSNTLKTLPKAHYWTSSANNSSAWTLQVWSGKLAGSDPVNSVFYVRCIRNLDNTNTTL